jgi:hypothetical protein
MQRTPAGLALGIITPLCAVDERSNRLVLKPRMTTDLVSDALKMA